METDSPLFVAMAAQCRIVIQQWDGDASANLPPVLRPAHLFWMCKMIERHARDWSATKLHRWIGFVQCAMIANHMIDLGGAKELFQRARIVHAEGIQDQDRDLIDHLDEQKAFELDLGGEG